MLSPFDQRLLEEKLGCRFKRGDLLSEALRHSSYVNEQANEGVQDNERLEFLGDAVLNLVIGHLLMRNFPHLKEGELSRIRATMVNETQLARLAREIQLGDFLKLGKGELLTNGREKSSLLANSFEALTAAVYLDMGYTVVFDFIERRFGRLLRDAPRLSMGQDHKSRLQETVQCIGKHTPSYEVVKVTGPDHEKIFSVTLRVGELETHGQGKSKKIAEQEAARHALAMLTKDG